MDQEVSCGAFWLQAAVSQAHLRMVTQPRCAYRGLEGHTVSRSYTVTPDWSLSALVPLQDSVMPSQEPAVDDKDDVDLPPENTDGSRAAFFPWWGLGWGVSGAFPHPWAETAGWGGPLWANTSVSGCRMSRGGRFPSALTLGVLEGAYCGAHHGQAAAQSWSHGNVCCQVGSGVSVGFHGRGSFLMKRSIRRLVLSTGWTDSLALSSQSLWVITRAWKGPCPRVLGVSPAP